MGLILSCRPGQLYIGPSEQDVGRQVNYDWTDRETDRQMKWIYRCASNSAFGHTPFCSGVAPMFRWVTIYATTPRAPMRAFSNSRISLLLLYRVLCSDCLTIQEDLLWTKDHTRDLLGPTRLLSPIDRSQSLRSCPDTGVKGKGAWHEGNRMVKGD